MKTIIALVLALIVGGCTIRIVCEHETPTSPQRGPHAVLPSMPRPYTAYPFSAESLDVVPRTWYHNLYSAETLAMPRGRIVLDTTANEITDERGISWSRDVWLDRERLKRDRR